MSHSPFAVFSAQPPRHIANAMREEVAVTAGVSSALFTQQQLQSSLAEIGNWPGYEPTPLHSLPGLAQRLGMASILYKDEGSRFGLGSFKALGGAYAVGEIGKSVQRAGETVTVATATDGNHGLSVVWGAKNHGYRAVIYIHAEVSEGRELALQRLGAEVRRIDGNYDDSVRICYTDAAANDWHVVSDTTFAGRGEDVARIVMTGYSVMAAELVDQFSQHLPTHVFVQGGVGGLAATVCAYFQKTLGKDAPRFIVVEPELAACLYASARNREPTAVRIEEETAMAGLSCGEVSSIAWPILAAFADDFLTIPESYVAPAMTLLARGCDADVSIIAGESAVAGLAGLIGSCLHTELREHLRLNEYSSVLVLGTEGATDPDLYASLTGHPVEYWQNPTRS